MDMAADCLRGVLPEWVLVAFAVRRKGGMAGIALVDGEELGSERSSPKGSKSGEEGLLAFAGGRPVGVEGGALFLPFLGGVVVIVYECKAQKRRF
jgi:hypothetical protein